MRLLIIITVFAVLGVHVVSRNNGKSLLTFVNNIHTQGDSDLTVCAHLRLFHEDAQNWIRPRKLRRVSPHINILHLLHVTTVKLTVSMSVYVVVLRELSVWKWEQLQGTYFLVSKRQELPQLEEAFKFPAIFEGSRRPQLLQVQCTPRNQSGSTHQVCVSYVFIYVVLHEYQESRQEQVAVVLYSKGKEDPEGILWYSQM